MSRWGSGSVIQSQPPADGIIIWVHLSFDYSIFQIWLHSSVDYESCLCHISFPAMLMLQSPHDPSCLQRKLLNKWTSLSDFHLLLLLTLCLLQLFSEEQICFQFIYSLNEQRWCGALEYHLQDKYQYFKCRLWLSIYFLNINTFTTSWNVASSQHVSTFLQSNLPYQAHRTDVLFTSLCNRVSGWISGCSSRLW